MKKSLTIIFFIYCNVFTVFSQNLDAPDGFYFYRGDSNSESIVLFWTDNSTGEDSFIIEGREDGEEWEVIKNVSANLTSCEIDNLSLLESIDLRIKAVNSETQSDYSNVIRIVGSDSELEVYPEIPGIRNPKDTTINGITFGMIQDQCPSEPEKGKATRISSFFEVEVRPVSEGEWKYSPTYEVRPQIRDQKSQNDPAHTGGHDVYAYGNYGPNSNVPSRTLHSRHWNNFDAQTDVVVRVRLLEGALSQTITFDQLEIHPAPLTKTLVDNSTIDVTLPGAGNDEMDFSRHYMITFNRKDWEDPNRGALIYEHPLMVFINPVKPAPASAPENTYKEFDQGRLIVVGPGIHLPDNHLRFFGDGENNTAEEVYIPGDAYFHGGFCLNRTQKPIHVWGRGVYSDELFLVHQEDDNWSRRTPWAAIRPAEGNAWGIGGSWEASIFFKGNKSQEQIVEGLSSISRRMGTSTKYGGSGSLIDHKDVGYAGGLYQEGDTRTSYIGIFAVNDDDITYTHEDYEMHYCTTRIYHNGPSFQFGWGVNNENNAGARVFDQTVLPADKRNSGYWHNHGVFNSRLQAGDLKQHSGGYWEDVKITGTENVVFNIGISSDQNVENANQISVFQDKTFKDFVIEHHSRSDNLLQTEVVPATNQKAYMRFIHFDNLVIEGNHVENIDDGDFFDYNEKVPESAVSSNGMNGTLLQTITFFSLPEPISEPDVGYVPYDRSVRIIAKKTDQVVQSDESLPYSLAPLCANSDNLENTFLVENAGDGYIALKAQNGHYVKADPTRYGYIYTLPDDLRGDSDEPAITDWAKFKWVDLGEGEFALYSKVMRRYLRVEENCGPEMPLYAASDIISENETFRTTPSNVSIQESGLSMVEVYPNPVSSILNIDNVGVGTEILIYDLNGRLIKRKIAAADDDQIGVSDLPHGKYILKFGGTDHSNVFLVL
ncbi:T9SS type A sorting domain-containing protein [Thermophagus sp. OGC60D27]|uniref:T9SS type A sorting domain-containing protein n=1 Tax=Thermophagus sp. OGC60D27 TaxID=3458415 RepID=UPI004037C201